MKIVQEKAGECKTFADLKPGDVFRDSGGDIAMKLEIVSEEDAQNAVVLRYNERDIDPFAYRYSDTDEVEHVYESAVLRLGE